MIEIRMASMINEGISAVVFRIGWLVRTVEILEEWFRFPIFQWDKEPIRIVVFGPIIFIARVSMSTRTKKFLD